MTASGGGDFLPVKLFVQGKFLFRGKIEVYFFACWSFQMRVKPGT
jgi:hypothetical protein